MSRILKVKEPHVAREPRFGLPRYIVWSSLDKMRSHSVKENNNPFSCEGSNVEFGPQQFLDPDSRLG